MICCNTRVRHYFVLIFFHSKATQHCDCGRGAAAYAGSAADARPASAATPAYVFGAGTLPAHGPAARDPFGRSPNAQPHTSVAAAARRAS